MLRKMPWRSSDAEVVVDDLGDGEVARALDDDGDVVVGDALVAELGRAGGAGGAGGAGASGHGQADGARTAAARSRRILNCSSRTSSSWSARSWASSSRRASNAASRAASRSDVGTATDDAAAGRRPGRPAVDRRPPRQRRAPRRPGSSPPRSCAHRFSFCPGWRSSRATRGSSRRARRAQGVVDVVLVGEGVQALAPGPQLARRLRPPQHEQADDGRLAPVEAEHLVEDLAEAVGPVRPAVDDAHQVQPPQVEQGVADGGLLQLASPGGGWWSGCTPTSGR